MTRLLVFALRRVRIEQDGHGVRTLVGVKGCPLSCRYCINPHVHRPETRVKMLSPEELIDRLSIDDLYFSATLGGPTFGGGEPLMHPDFLAEFGRALDGRWSVCVETSLNVPKEAVETALPHVDQWIVDIKDMDPEIYRAYTGGDSARVLENLPLLPRDRTLVRVPAIPGFAQDCSRSEQILREMGFENIDRFEYIVRSGLPL